MSGVVARLLLRYGVGALIAHGVIHGEFGHDLMRDPDVESILEIGIGGGIAVVTEGWYLLAKKFGWST